MSEQDRQAEYAICRRRGHQGDGGYTQGWESWWVCKWCGTHYRTKETLVEKNTPKEASGD